MRIRHAANIAPRARAALALVALVAGALALACGDGGSEEPAAPATATAAAPASAATTAASQATATAATAATATSTSAATATAAATPEDRTSVFGDEGFEESYPQFTDEEAGLTLVFGTPDLGVGPQRIAFVLSDETGIVKLPIASLSGSFGGGEAQTVIARYYDFPEGIRGLYVGELNFDRAGEWMIEVSLPRPDGSRATISFPVTVADRTSAPAVGDPAPASLNRTLADVESVNHLSTGAEPDPALYELTIAEALEAGRPFVIVFASPGFLHQRAVRPPGRDPDRAARASRRSRELHPRRSVRESAGYPQHGSAGGDRDAAAPGVGSAHAGVDLHRRRGRARGRAIRGVRAGSGARGSADRAAGRGVATPPPPILGS